MIIRPPSPCCAARTSQNPTKLSCAPSSPVAASRLTSPRIGQGALNALTALAPQTPFSTVLGSARGFTLPGLVFSRAMSNNLYSVSSPPLGVALSSRGLPPIRGTLIGLLLSGVCPMTCGRMVQHVILLTPTFVELRGRSAGAGVTRTVNGGALRQALSLGARQLAAQNSARLFGLINVTPMPTSSSTISTSPTV